MKKVAYIYRKEDYANAEEARKDGALYYAELTGDYEKDLDIIANATANTMSHSSTVGISIEDQPENYLDYSEVDQISDMESQIDTYLHEIGKKAPLVPAIEVMRSALHGLQDAIIREYPQYEWKNFGRPELQKQILEERKGS
jgi:hypothetical protein